MSYDETISVETTGLTDWAHKIEHPAFFALSWLVNFSVT